MGEHSQVGSWVNAARQGNELALAKLLASYHPRLRARAEARMDPAIKARGGPDDILQEVYLQVFRQIGQFEERGPDAFIKWVNTILDHKLIDVRRAARRKVRDVAREVPGGVGTNSSSYWNLLDQLQNASGTPSRVIRREEALGALLECISDLPESYRQVVQLRFLEGISVADVATRLNKTEGAVVAQTKRALEMLRDAMDRRGEFTRG